jgi:hypothetical protein
VEPHPAGPRRRDADRGEIVREFGARAEDLPGERGRMRAPLDIALYIVIHQLGEWGSDCPLLPMLTIDDL